MANRHDLAARVRALLDGRQLRGRAGTWLVAGVSCVAAALVVLLSPMRVVAGTPRPQVGGSRPQFDVVSVKPCDPNEPRPPAPAGGGRGGSKGRVSLGRFRLDCRSLNYLIRDAYQVFAGGQVNPPSARPSFDMQNTGPAWIRSEKFTIEAVTSDATPVSVMQGPMLQAVLEDRFKLKMRRETREVPVYELIVSNGGAKLTPFKPGTCVPWDQSARPQPALEPGQRRCTAYNQRGADGKYVMYVEAMTLDNWIASFEDRDMLLGEPPIVNKTGITGLQGFRYTYSGNSDDRAAEFKNQLGLELRPGRGLREFLVIDHVERPVPDAAVVATARATGPGQ